MGLNVKPKYLMYAAAAVAVYVLYKGGIKSAVKDTVGGAIEGAASGVGGVIEGTVIGIGKVLGVPEVSEDRCRQAIANGDNYSASQYCSAPIYLKWQSLSVRKKLTGKTFTMADVFN